MLDDVDVLHKVGELSWSSIDFWGLKERKTIVMIKHFFEEEWTEKLLIQIFAALQKKKLTGKAIFLRFYLIFPKQPLFYCRKLSRLLHC